MSSTFYEDSITVGIWSVAFMVIGLFAIGIWVGTSNARSSINSEMNTSNSNISSSPTNEVKEVDVNPVISESVNDADVSGYNDNHSAGIDMDCGDFGSWSEAQYYYENIADDNLDRDSDGIACESLQ